MSKKKTYVENLRTKTEGELTAMLTEKEEARAKERLRVRARQNSNIREPGKIKTEIAQIKTVLKEFSRKENSK